MLGYFYNTSIRRYVLLMGQLFNGVQVARKRNDVISYQKVPIVYANKERFALKMNSILNKNTDTGIAKIETILPRMNIHMVDMIYNPLFKTGINVRSTNLGAIKSVSRHNPVPYKFMFELSIYTRYEDDMFQIVEQILPYFQPNFNTTITELHDSASPIDRDIQITIQSVSMSEDIEGDAMNRRRLQWDIVFELDGYLYPPIQDLKGEIKTIYLDFASNEVALDQTGSMYESIDEAVDPLTSQSPNWDGKTVSTQSENVPIPVNPAPPKPRKNPTNPIIVSEV